MKKFLSIICLSFILLNSIPSHQTYAVWLEPKCAPNKCLDADRSPITSNQNGATCNIWGYGGASWQNWIRHGFVQGFIAPKEYIILKNSANPSKCLDENVSNSRVLAWDCHNGRNQEWELWPASGRCWYLINRETGHYLTATGSSDGSPVKALPRNGSDCQKWKIHN